jgi:hypothetical protein
MHRTVATLILASGLATTAWAADNVVQWDTAEQHIGEEAIVEGRVLGVHCSPLSCLLAFDPTFNRFTAVVQAKDFGTFPPDQLDGKYSGRQVRVRGTIIDRDRKPEIVLSSVDDLKLVETKEDKQKKIAERAEAQDQVLDRLDALIDRVEGLTERMVTMQERLETVVAALDERTQALMIAAATPAPPPAQPTYGGPQPRPDWEAMRSIKRGMAAGEVRRLMGDPMRVIPGGNGWSTWLYDDGRSVSFDGRGRAQSLAGFPGS